MKELASWTIRTVHLFTELLADLSFIVIRDVGLLLELGLSMCERALSLESAYLVAEFAPTVELPVVANLCFILDLEGHLVGMLVAASLLSLELLGLYLLEWSVPLAHAIGHLLNITETVT